MTAIIAIKDGKKIMIGSDGYASGNNYKSPILVESNFKIFPVKNSPGCFIAGTGLLAGLKIIRNIPLFDGKQDVCFKKMINNVLPKIYDACLEAKLCECEDGYNKLPASLIIITKNHIYSISAYGIVLEHKNIAINGSGDYQLLNKYLEIKDKKISLREKMELCLRHAITYGDGIGFPIVMHYNDNQEDFIYLDQ